MKPRRRAAPLLTILACLALASCVTTSVDVEASEPRSLGIVRGKPVEQSRLGVHVELDDSGAQLEARALRIGLCERAELSTSKRVERKRTEVSTFTVIVAGVLAGIGVAFYMSPGARADEAATTGSAFLGAGGLVYLLPKLAEERTEREIEPRTSWRRLSPAACPVEPVAGAVVRVVGASTMLQGRTDASGRVRFAGQIDRSAKVLVQGRAADSIEWKDP